MDEALNQVGEFARLLYFTAIVPYIRFRERLDRRIVIHPDYNDVCISAADLSVSCYHLPEHLDATHPGTAAKVRDVPEWKALGEIANTRKHVQRHNPKKAVSLRANLLFELGPNGGFRFIATNVFARCEAWSDELNVSPLLSGFINSVLDLTKLFPGIRLSPHFNPTGDFEPKVRASVGPESFGVARTDYQLVRLTPEGNLEPVAGMTLELELDVDMPDQQGFGPHKIHFDPAAAQRWVAEVLAPSQVE